MNCFPKEPYLNLAGKSISYKCSGKQNGSTTYLRLELGYALEQNGYNYLFGGKLKLKCKVYEWPKVGNPLKLLGVSGSLGIAVSLGGGLYTDKRQKCITNEIGFVLPLAATYSNGQKLTLSEIEKQSEFFK